MLTRQPAIGVLRSSPKASDTTKQGAHTLRLLAALADIAEEAPTPRLDKSRSLGCTIGRRNGVFPWYRFRGPRGSVI